MALKKPKRYQCKYCGNRRATMSGFSPLKTQCPRRPKGQTHVWERES